MTGEGALTMYLIGFNSAGINPAGTAHTHKTSYKTARKWREVATNMARNNRGWGAYKQVSEVYAIRDYTQTMCEMSGAEFARHVKSKGVKIWEV